MKRPKKISLFLLMPSLLFSCGQGAASASDGSSMSPDPESPSSTAAPKPSSEKTADSSSRAYYPYTEYRPVEGEDFDPGKSYEGMPFADYLNMAHKYAFCPLGGYIGGTEEEQLWTEGLFASFSYGNCDVFARRGLYSHYVDEFCVKEKKRLTLSEARQRGFFGKKMVKERYIWYKRERRCKSSETYWASDFTLEQTIEARAQFGAWDSLMVLLDRITVSDTQARWCFPNGVMAVLRGAFTIYADDLSEVVGVSVVANPGPYLLTYLKEDGYDQKITPEEYASGVKRAEATGESFGRNGFYFTPDEFKPLGLTAFFDLLGGPIDL